MRKFIKFADSQLEQSRGLPGPQNQIPDNQQLKDSCKLQLVFSFPHSNVVEWLELGKAKGFK